MWTLHINSNVTAYLYSLRDAGQSIRDRIRALANEQEPWIGAIVNPTLPNTYEVDAGGHWVGFQVDVNRRVIIVLYVVAN